MAAGCPGAAPLPSGSARSRSRQGYIQAGNWCRLALATLECRSEALTFCTTSCVEGAPHISQAGPGRPGIARLLPPRLPPNPVARQGRTGTVAHSQPSRLAEILALQQGQGGAGRQPDPFKTAALNHSATHPARGTVASAPCRAGRMTSSWPRQWRALSWMAVCQQADGAHAAGAGDACTSRRVAHHRNVDLSTGPTSRRLRSFPAGQVLSAAAARTRAGDEQASCDDRPMNPEPPRRRRLLGRRRHPSSMSLRLARGCS
jgi:hypothetical protein